MENNYFLKLYTACEKLGCTVYIFTYRHRPEPLGHSHGRMTGGKGKE